MLWDAIELSDNGFICKLAIVSNVNENVFTFLIRTSSSCWWTYIYVLNIHINMLQALGCGRRSCISHIRRQHHWEEDFTGKYINMHKWIVQMMIYTYAFMDSEDIQIPHLHPVPSPCTLIQTQPQLWEGDTSFPRHSRTAALHRQCLSGVRTARTLPSNARPW